MIAAQTRRSAPLQNLRQHLASNRSLARLLTYHQRRQKGRRERTPAELERSRQVAAAKAAAANAASPRFMHRKTPMGLADERRVARAVGVRKLTPTASGILGFVRRAVACGKSGVWFSHRDFARRLNCHPESVRRALRQLERLELVVRVTQYHHQPWLQGQGEGARLHRSMRTANVLVLGPVGRQWCEPSRQRKPAQAHRQGRQPARRAPSRRWRGSWGGYNLYPSEDLPSGTIPEGRESRGDSAAAHPAREALAGFSPVAPRREEVSPSETSDPAACRRPQSNTPATPATSVGELAAPARSGADEVGEGAAERGQPGPGAAPLAHWAALCPSFAAPDEREDLVPESPPGDADRSQRGDS